MEYCVKRIAPGPSKGYNYPSFPVKYEFSVPEATKDVNGVDVFIPKVLYVHSLEELESQRDTLVKSLEEINLKIDSINALNSGVKVELKDIVASKTDK